MDIKNIEDTFHLFFDNGVMNKIVRLGINKKFSE